MCATLKAPLYFNLAYEGLKHFYICRGSKSNTVRTGMEEFEYVDYEDYNENDTFDNNSLSEYVAVPYEGHLFGLKTTLLVANVSITLLGICGNGVVIWIAGFRMKRTVSSTWYFSLALSDFLFCTWHPFNVTHMVMSTWSFGLVLCKLTPLILLLNMFSSILVLVLISVDRCLSATLPVWSLNHRTVRKASLMVLLAWLISAALSVPTLPFRDTRVHSSRTVCYTDYGVGHTAVVLSRFICGFAVPFLLIVCCYAIIVWRLKSKHRTKTNKPFQVMSALVATFFVCWAPYHAFTMLELHFGTINHTVLKTGLDVGTTLAAANSCLNPLLYVLMGKDFKNKLRSSFFGRIENVIGDDGQTRTRGQSRVNSTEDGRAGQTVV